MYITADILSAGYSGQVRHKLTPLIPKLMRKKLNNVTRKRHKKKPVNIRYDFTETDYSYNLIAVYTQNPTIDS